MQKGYRSGYPIELMQQLNRETVIFGVIWLLFRKHMVWIYNIWRQSANTEIRTALIIQRKNLNDTFQN